jgi:hypothetical protein
MRTLLLVGGATGLVGAVGALALAPHLGLAAVAGIVLAGIASGLGAAKWLPRAWYGRQFAAGLCTGAISSVIAAASALASLLALAPQHDAIATSVHAQLQGSSLPAAISTSRTVTDVLAVCVAAVIAIVLAAGIAPIFAAGKSGRFVQAVARAREASQPLREQSIFAPALARQTAVPLAALSAGSAAALAVRSSGAQPAVATTPSHRRTLAPATPPEGIAGTATERRTLAPRQSAGPAPVAPAAHAVSADYEASAAPKPYADPDAATPAAPALKRRGGGRPAPAHLTPEMIEALAAWARDVDDEEAGDAEDKAEMAPEAAVGRARKSNPAPASRKPVESSYLNDPAPAPKRKRKKNATRDWIC